jgi:hypothetical protein
MKVYSLSSKKVAVKIVSAGIGVMAVGLQIVTSACNDNEESVFPLSSAANEVINAAYGTALRHGMGTLLVEVVWGKGTKNL